MDSISVDQIAQLGGVVVVSSLALYYMRSITKELTSVASLWSQTAKETVELAKEVLASARAQSPKSE